MAWKSLFSRIRPLVPVDRRVEDSQSALLDAVRSTAFEAEQVTKLLRRELDDSIRQLELTAGILNDGLLVCNLNGDVVSMNPAAEKLFQRSKAAGRLHVCDLFDVEGISGLWERIAGSDTTIFGKRADEQRFTAQINLARLDKADGSITYLLLVRDELDDSLHAVQPLIETGLDGVVVIQNDTILAANPAVAGRLGYDGIGFTGIRAAQIVAPEALSLFRSNCANIALDAQFDTLLVTKAGIKIEARITLTHIEWHGVDVTLATILFPDEDASIGHPGDVIRCFGDSYSMRSVRLSRDLYPLVCYLEPDLTIKYANAAFCAQYGVAEPLCRGMNLRDLLPPAEIDSAVLHLISLRRNSPERTMNLHIRLGNNPRHQEWVDTAIYDADGRLTEYRRTGRALT